MNDYRTRLDSVERRARRKTVLRIAGIVVMAIGVMHFPMRHLGFIRADTSAFHRIAEVGEFLPWGATWLGLGLLLFGASFLIRGDLSE